MHDPVSHAYDFSPRNLRKAQLTFLRNMARRLSNHLHEMGERELHIIVSFVLVSVELRCAQTCFASHIQHMAEIEKIIRLHIEPRLP